MYKVYILKSLKSNRYYIGHSKDVEKSLQQHNNGEVKSTRPFRPFKLIYTEDFNSKSQAFKREFELKKIKSRKSLEKLFLKNFGEVA